MRNSFSFVIPRSQYKPKKSSAILQKKYSVKFNTQKSREILSPQKSEIKIKKYLKQRQPSPLNDLDLGQPSQKNLKELKNRISKILESLPRQPNNSIKSINKHRRQYIKINKKQRMEKNNFYNKKSVLFDNYKKMPTENINQEKYIYEQIKNGQKFPILKRSRNAQDSPKPFIIQLSNSLIPHQNSYKKSYFSREKPDNSEQIYKAISFISRSKLSKNMKLQNYINKEDIFKSQKISPKANDRIIHIYQQKHQQSKPSIKKQLNRDNQIKPWEKEGFENQNMIF